MRKSVIVGLHHSCPLLQIQFIFSWTESLGVVEWPVWEMFVTERKSVVCMSVGGLDEGSFVNRSLMIPLVLFSPRRSRRSLQLLLLSSSGSWVTPTCRLQPPLPPSPNCTASWVRMKAGPDAAAWPWPVTHIYITYACLCQKLSVFIFKWKCSSLKCFMAWDVSWPGVTWCHPVVRDHLCS